MTTDKLLSIDPYTLLNGERLRRERLQRMLEAMERHDVNALLLHKDGNIRYATDARSTFTFGRRGFTPAIVTRDGQIFIVTSAPEGKPQQMPQEHVIPRRWSLDTLVKDIKGSLGLLGRGRIGVDVLNVALSQALQRELPEATLVNGEAVMQEARLIKTPDEVQCLRLALTISQAALHQAVEHLRPGIRETDLAAVFQRRCTDFGVHVTVNEGVFCAQPQRKEDILHAFKEAPWRRLTSDKVLQEGDVVVLSGGAMYRGYAGEVGRTWFCASQSRPKPEQRDLHRRWLDVYLKMLEECHPGRTASMLRKAAQTMGPLPPRGVAHGLGMGYEPPIVGTTLGKEFEERWVLQPGMVLVLEPAVWSEGAGGYLAKETVLITERGPEPLGRFPYGPLAE